MIYPWNISTDQEKIDTKATGLNSLILYLKHVTSDYNSRGLNTKAGRCRCACKVSLEDILWSFISREESEVGKRTIERMQRYETKKNNLGKEINYTKTRLWMKGAWLNKGVLLPINHWRIVPSHGTNWATRHIEKKTIRKHSSRSEKNKAHWKSLTSDWPVSKIKVSPSPFLTFHLALGEGWPCSGSKVTIKVTAQCQRSNSLHFLHQYILSLNKHTTICELQTRDFKGPIC